MTSKLPLPHAYPFLLLDRVIEVQPGLRAVAIRNLAATDPLVRDGILSASLLAEAMAQCAGVAVASLRPGGMAVLARIDRLRCKRAMGAASQLEISARVVRVFGHTVKARCVVRADGHICAAAELILQFADGASLTLHAAPRREADVE